jgi:hypothetical protein
LPKKKYKKKKKERKIERKKRKRKKPWRHSKTAFFSIDVSFEQLNVYGYQGKRTKTLNKSTYKDFKSTVGLAKINSSKIK